MAPRRLATVASSFASALSWGYGTYDPRSGLLRFADLRTQVGPATDILSIQLAGTQ
jgi:hypothetical protein